MNFRPAARAVFFTALLVCLATADARAVYTVTDLGSLTNLSGQSDATISAINLAGKAAGISASNTYYNSFIYGGSRTNLGTLGGPNCRAQGINSANAICGSSTTAGGAEHAFRWTPGATNGVAGNRQMMDLGTFPAGNSSDCFDINQSGQIAGASSVDPGDNVFHACRFNTNGSLTDIGLAIGPYFPGGPNQSYAYGINQTGQAVGSVYDNTFSTPEGFYFSGGGVTMLGDLTGFGGSPGSYNSEAFAVSGGGQVTGYAIYGGTSIHAFRWSINGTNGTIANPRMVDLGTLGGSQSSGWSINASNAVVGKSLNSGDTEDHAFIAADNTMLDLNGLLDASSNNWVLTKAEFINDAGTICGFGNLSGVLHGFLLTPAYAPNITNQPSPVAVVVSNNATFTVVAGGNPPPAYQWRLNGTNISYGTGASLTITNCQATNAGNYTVVLTNYSGSVTSLPAALTVNFPPGISAPPSPVSVIVSNNATFTVTASGTATLIYQWRQNGTNVSYGTGTSLTITNCQATNAGNYTVVITNNFGSITSSPAALTVNFPPGISAPPSPVSVIVSNNATFTVTASGTATLVYQWRQNGTNLSYGTGTALTITNCQATNAGNYTVVITNNYGSITSSPAALTVNFPPGISTPPASQTVLVGSNATFSVACGGTAPLAYQWKFAANLPGQTNASLTITSAQAGSAGNYSVIVTNNFGSVTSAPAYLNVVPVPLLVSISVTNASVLLGFNTSTGATYAVESKTNLAAGGWQGAVTNIAGTGGLKLVTHTNGAGRPLQIYRVRVTVP
jgi:probable HAF family extracellular repeat protein